MRAVRGTQRHVRAAGATAAKRAKGPPDPRRLVVDGRRGGRAKGPPAEPFSPRGVSDEVVGFADRRGKLVGGA